MYNFKQTFILINYRYLFVWINIYNIIFNLFIFIIIINQQTLNRQKLNDQALKKIELK